MKANGETTSNMAMELKVGRVVPNSKVNSTCLRRKVKVSTYMPMELIMKVNGLTIK